MSNVWNSIYYPNYISGYNPFLLKHMNKAIEKLVDAINNRKKIVVYGISNVDGICAIASLTLLLRYLNADVEYLVHDEIKSRKIDCKTLKDNIDFLGTDLLITLGVDLKGEEELKLCSKLGIDFVILENKKTDIEKKYIYINPNQKGCQYRYKNLSLSEVTFKLMQSIAIYYSLKSINKYLDLITIGSKWLELPAKGENAVILKEGKKFLVGTNNYGLRAIMDFNKIIDLNDENIFRIIEFITPSVNPVGVLGNSKIVVELLTTDDKDRAEQIVKYLHSLNRNNEIDIS